MKSSGSEHYHQTLKLGPGIRVGFYCHPHHKLEINAKARWEFCGVMEVGMMSEMERLGGNRRIMQWQWCNNYF